jgi:hypothetical protein
MPWAMAPPRPPAVVPALAHSLALALLLGSVGRPLIAGALDRGEQIPTTPAPEALREARLTDVGARPLELLGRKVELILQVHSRPETWNPLLTRFGPDDYLGLKCWGDEQFLWDPVQYDDPAGMVFARRGTPAAESLAGADRFARFRVEARVVQVFAGRPWIEVLAAERLSEELNEGTILHASRALQLMASEEWALALEDLTRAMDAWPPQGARTELLRLRELAQAGLDARAKRRLVR